jgi:excisionase family DNA binding protein
MIKPAATSADAPEDDLVSTAEAARILGLAVRSVQLMVDRGELSAWKTPGGHRRISRESIEHWRIGAAGSDHAKEPPSMRSGGDVSGVRPPNRAVPGATRRVLLIEDSIHFQNLVSLLLRQQFPDVDLRVASDAIAGLALVGQFQPDVLVVDIMLPGIDGATLITSLRSNPQFADLRLIVITSLDAAQREPYAFALKDVPVIHKPMLVTELPALLSQALRVRA